MWWTLLYIDGGLVVVLIIVWIGVFISAWFLGKKGKIVDPLAWFSVRNDD